ncbi:MAG: dienelactone hydrolase family protein [Gammaproteobacteria bacterium]|nr:dienelactone hydrolase family protein [Gammaproteobacteria bacterium]NIR82672.1 dienelactone hydrolase family protein [Gammaproteobacteria bacterium]NIR89379.1 dienelactone hydrolase family protein [Gammaproteobacteria bacterium]NIU03820.1 dienelactone hydrolase family protein [Gammaproteobacteria bacterium]NIV51154.1 dienelactone hydrolase family protein [Gammaproteobacteria bacterium]
MGTTLQLDADDGHTLSTYRADPQAKPRAGIAVVQEVFGVNEHVRRVCDDFAARGYVAIAPALFERIERGVELGYTDEALARGRELRTALGWDDPLRDVAAALAVLRQAGKVGVVGYCWGGSVAWLSATRLDADCAVCYYGGQIVQFCEERARCPVLMHFGERDPIIAAEDVERIRSAQPEIPIYTYPAGHGFNCDARADYDPQSAALAKERTLAFLAEHVG